MPGAITTPPAPANLPRIRWRAAQYESLFAMNLLPHGKNELLGGDVVEKAPIEFRHARIITLLLLYFNRFCSADALGSAFTLAVDDNNMPEPDFAVLTTDTPALTPRGYGRPEDVRLVVEVVTRPWQVIFPRNRGFTPGRTLPNTG